MFSINLFLCVIFINAARANFFDIYPNILKKEIVGDPGERLILTPLIKDGRIEEAQSAALVQFSDFKNVKSYSGFLTVNESYNSNLFFWFFPSENDYANDPVLLWLQGGPGASSLFGLFTENGPFIVDENQKLSLREYSWTKNHSVIYIDNPAGAGYSFTNDGGYSRDQTQIGKEMYEALHQFFLLFPELQENEFFLTGESYAGKYIPAIAREIYQKNEFGQFYINLKGLAIGDGLSDPEHQIGYAEYLYQVGLIDINKRDAMTWNETYLVFLINLREWANATDMMSTIMDDIQETIGNINMYNYGTVGQADPQWFGEYIQQTDVRAALHVGDAEYDSQSVEVGDSLHDDISKSVASIISEVLNYYRVLLFSGQMDIVVPYPLTLNYLQNLEFSAKDDYANAQRTIWRVEDNVAGYIKKAGNLTEVLVRNAGHMVPTDQPQWAYDLITKFVRDKL